MRTHSIMRSTRWLAALLLFGAAFAPQRASAINIGDGELIVVIRKSGKELIKNLGRVVVNANDRTWTSQAVDVNFALPGLAGFGGTLADADYIAAFAVADFDLLRPPPSTLARPNFLTTVPGGDPDPITSSQLGNSKNAILGPTGTSGWFQDLRAITVGTGVDFVDATTIVMTSGGAGSYEERLGLGTNTIGGNFPRVVAALDDPAAGSLFPPVPLWSILQFVSGASDNFGATNQDQAIQAGELRVTGTVVSFAAVPEPSSLLLLGAALGGLAFVRKARG